MKAENKRCCRHYREGLPYCAECAKDEAERNEALHAQIAELKAELSEARAEIERLREYTTCTLESTDAEMDDKDIQIIQKDKLIEQMREALIVADSLVTSLIDTHVDRCASIYDFDRDIIKAALSAAERINK